MEPDPDSGSVTLKTSIPKWPEWWLTADLARDPEGHPVVTRIEVAPDPRASAPPGGIKAAMLRDVPVARLPMILADDSTLEGWHRGIFDLTMGPEFLADAEQPPSKGGRPRLSPEELAKWALRYVLACRVSSSPYQVLNEQHHYPVRAIRNYTGRAQQDRLFRSMGRGRTGGEMTPLGIEVLEASTDAEVVQMLKDYREESQP